MRDFGLILRREDLPHDIDPEIVDVVLAINRAGFPTYGSCSGHQGPGELAWVGLIAKGLRGLRDVARWVNAVVYLSEDKASDDCIGGDVYLDLGLKWDADVAESILDITPGWIPLYLEVAPLRLDEAPSVETLGKLARVMDRATTLLGDPDPATEMMEWLGVTKRKRKSA